ncbi:hypothetical protein AZI86_04180 [Bdellovibrio bacteriovorus]|uniref:Lipoprotein n=1 Tax=Bdellovibrio bacteriovorus TaxID=959 RepID=A0A150WPL4_BDEBC|nr:hypothetical protein [Bdellovibrio bacteriovorus]KYG66264.1 hypothetical protein AZI86_04180 [Bdellovibrio bacteriovorus]
MKARYLVLLISGFTMAVLFQNCQKQALKIDDMGPASLSVDGLGNEDHQDYGNPPGVNNLINSCADAKARGKIQVKTVQINFEDNVGECPFGSGDNLSAKNEYIRARVEQSQKVQVPAGATVCQVSMDNFEQQNFLYDDNIILTLNSYVLASTTNFSRHLQSSNGYYKYDWSRLVDKDAQNGAVDSSPANQYCAGKSQGLSSCLFPQTETVGRVELQFDEKVVQNILGMTSASDITLHMITTGDNDSKTDCHHSPVRLMVQVEYF